MNGPVVAQHSKHFIRPLQEIDDPPLQPVRAQLLRAAWGFERCQLDCWREAYADLADPVRLGRFLSDVEGNVARWRQRLDSPAVVRVAVAAGQVVGFATVRPAYDETPAHLAAIYTRGTYWGTGLGQLLLDATLGDEPATLRVFRDNTRARRFYARNGFVPDGTEVEEPRLGAIEIGMVRPGPR